jgi:penicillin-binding protein 2
MCLLYSAAYATHQDVDASQALMVSCNYFYYILGYRMTWQMMDETAKALGLGEPTGIELVEKVGWRANPDSKAASYTGIDAVWNAGDKVLMAIGQSENRFTPLQLCVYASTLANQGKRMKATFLNRVVSSDYRTLVLDNEPQIAHTLNMSYQTIEMYMQGMHKVVYAVTGTADSYFGGPEDFYGVGDGIWPMKGKVTVWAKTGTAEHASGGSDHGAFICFAGRTDGKPEVAIAIYGEKAAHGSTLAPVAEDILEAYFEKVGASEVFVYENQVS